MTTLSDIMKTDNKLPYEKSIRGKIVYTADPVTYKNAQGETRHSKSAAIADESCAVKLVCYDDNKFGRITVGNTLLLRNVIRRDGNIILTKTSKVFPTQNITVPETRVAEGRALVHPPEAAVLPLKEALKSPAKVKTSVCGKIIQDEEEREVMVRNTPTKVRNIYLSDVSMEKVKVSLWRDTCMEMRTGDYVQVSDVVVNVYKNETSLNTSYNSRVTKMEQPASEVFINVVGVSVMQDRTEVLTDDDSVHSVSSELLLSALPEGTRDPELYFMERNDATKMKIIARGSDIVSIELVDE